MDFMPFFLLCTAEVKRLDPTPFKANSPVLIRTPLSIDGALARTGLFASIVQDNVHARHEKGAPTAYCRGG